MNVSLVFKLGWLDSPIYQRFFFPSIVCSCYVTSFLKGKKAKKKDRFDDEQRLSLCSAHEREHLVSFAPFPFSSPSLSLASSLSLPPHMRSAVFAAASAGATPSPRRRPGPSSPSSAVPSSASKASSSSFASSSSSPSPSSTHSHSRRASSPAPPSSTVASDLVAVRHVHEYRRNVGICLVNASGKVFAARCVVVEGKRRRKTKKKRTPSVAFFFDVNQGQCFAHAVFPLPKHFLLPGALTTRTARGRCLRYVGAKEKKENFFEHKETS